MGIINLFRRKEDILDTVFSQLNNPLQEIREDALSKLENLQLSVEQGLRVLEMAKNTFPPSKYDWQDISAQLIDICAVKPYVEYINKVEYIYDELNPNAKVSALQFLSTYESEQALIIYLKLLARGYDELKSLPYGSLYERPRFPQILFPGLLKFIDNKEIVSQIYLILLNYFNYDLVDETTLGDYKKTIVSDIIDMAEKVTGYALKKSTVSIWDDDEYLSLRNKAGIYFDLAGYIKDPRVTLALKGIMCIKDMKLKMFAAMSLLQHDYGLQEEDVIDIASDSEVRNWFYESLVKIGKDEIYPEQFKSQKCFAESDMVNWLVYPTELGRVPDKIELMNVFQEGDMEYYLFRFRCDSKKDWEKVGWMAGLSGPFSKKNCPTTVAEGHTFSRFEEWDSKTPQEHFSNIVGNIRDYWSSVADDLQ